MRERVAQAVCFFTVALVVALSLAFALRQNPRPTAAPSRTETAAVVSPPPVTVPVVPAVLVRGRAVFAAQGCARCHAVAGEGNPRSSLDGVGARLDPGAVEAWITGTGVAAERLPVTIATRKQRYRDLPEADLRALVAYVGGLPAAPRSP